MYFARTVLVLLLASIVGLVGYQIGLSQNVAAQIPAVAAPGAVPAYYWYGPHMFGLGFFGFLFPLLFLFLFIGLIRAAVGGGHGWGRHGWGDGYGHDWRRGRLEEIHRELHGEKPQGGGTSTTNT